METRPHHLGFRRWWWHNADSADYVHASTAHDMNGGREIRPTDASLNDQADTPKTTGFPIAQLAAKLAVGYLLDEIKNDITRQTPASFEPRIDYGVTKIPRFAFEKFPEADPRPPRR